MNFQFENEQKRKFSKTVFVLWTPTNAMSKNKFLYCSSKSSILNTFIGIQLEIQADDCADVTWQIIKEKILAAEK